MSGYRESRMQGFTIVRVLFIAVATLLAFAGANAEPPKEEVCADVAKKAARNIWDSVRESADELFCRKAWVERTPEELIACASSNSAITFSNKLKNKWNAFFDKADAEWATWGPRGIGPDWETGTIRKGFKRTFFGAGLAATRSTIEVKKTDGRAEAFMTVCELDYDGTVTDSHRRSFPNGNDNIGAVRSVEIEHTNNRIIGVVIDTDFSVNTFSYQGRLKAAPIRNNIEFEPGTSGIADLHVHQFMDVAFAGRFYWGSHTGDKVDGLGEEIVNGSLAPLFGRDPAAVTLQEISASLTRGHSVDANLLLKVLGGKKDDEGFWQVGGGGHPSYQKWPHHADRSHQQVHISWLEAAHKRGLNLIVVSVVNNDVLCKVLKAADAYGNVPIKDGSGRIVGWESANWGCSDHENVLRQLRAIHALEKRYPWYRVAMTPWHAREIIQQGDLAVIVSLETDKPLSSEDGTYGNFTQQLDEYRALGLTTTQLVHESNSRFCGAAPHRNMLGALQLVHNPAASLGNVIDNLLGSDPMSFFNLDSQGKNELGMTNSGRELVDALVKRNMPIDLAHASERCRRAVFGTVPPYYGLYDSHTKFEALLRPARGQKDYGQAVLKREQEFLISEDILQDYLDHKVLIGLRTASVDVYDAPNARVANTCPGSSRSFAQLVQYAHNRGLEFAFGTDFNTGVSQLGPRFGNKNRCYAADVASQKHPSRPASDQEPSNPEVERRRQEAGQIDGTNYYVDGLAHIGWLPELVEDLRLLGTPGASKLYDSAAAYLRMWERAYDYGVQGTQTGSGTQPGSGTQQIEYTISLADGDVSAGDVSGFAGQREPVGDAGNTYALERLQFGEREDRGCYVRVEKGHIQGPGHGERRIKTFDLCGSKGPTDSSLEYVPLLTTSHDTFIYGVAACTSGVNDKRLKGVKVYRAKITETGDWQRVSTPALMDRPNCKTWHPAAMCDEGSLASELVINYQLENSKKEEYAFTGLNLRCRKMSVTEKVAGAASENR